MPSATADDLFRAGQLEEAIELLGVEVRSNPTNAQRRTFLFELLCFAGEHDRAEKQLDVLASGTRAAEMGALLYRAALHAERIRQDMFRKNTYPNTSPVPPAPSGTLNGRPFTSLTDADPRIGARLEIFAAGQYTWIPFEHIASVRMDSPKRLRDLLWAPAIVRTGPALRDTELGEVLLPVLAALTADHHDPAVRLGRLTDWTAAPDEPPRPAGQKLLLVDGEEFPILELRELDITPTATAAG